MEAEQIDIFCHALLFCSLNGVALLFYTTQPLRKKRKIKTLIFISFHPDTVKAGFFMLEEKDNF